MFLNCQSHSDHLPPGQQAKHHRLLSRKQFLRQYQDHPLIFSWLGKSPLWNIQQDAKLSELMIPAQLGKKPSGRLPSNFTSSTNKLSFQRVNPKDASDTSKPTAFANWINWSAIRLVVGWVGCKQVGWGGGGVKLKEVLQHIFGRLAHLLLFAGSSQNKRHSRYTYSSHTNDPITRVFFEQGHISSIFALATAFNSNEQNSVNVLSGYPLLRNGFAPLTIPLPANTATLSPRLRFQSQRP